MVKRTTVSADSDDLDVIEYEARRRGVSVSHMLHEAVAKYAADIRTTAPKPRFGIARGGPDLAQASVDDEEAPFRPEPDDEDA